MFPGYDEAPIEFMPTYKRSKDGEGYANKKDQCPSYTDRILYRVNSKNQVETQILDYRSIEKIYGSDHRPVILEMALKMATFDQYIDMNRFIDQSKQELQGSMQLAF